MFRAEILVYVLAGAFAALWINSIKHRRNEAGQKIRDLVEGYAIAALEKGGLVVGAIFRSLRIILLLGAIFMSVGPFLNSRIAVPLGAQHIAVSVASWSAFLFADALLKNMSLVTSTMRLILLGENAGRSSLRWVEGIPADSGSSGDTHSESMAIQRVWVELTPEIAADVAARPGPSMPANEDAGRLARESSEGQLGYGTAGAASGGGPVGCPPATIKKNVPDSWFI